MSRENVEIVRQVFEAVARRDADAVLALYDPAVEMQAAPGTLMEQLSGALTYRGHEGLRAADRNLRDAFAHLETPCEELIDAGDHVISAPRYVARGRGSGVEIEGPTQFGVWTIRDGKVVRTVWFNTREAALAAAGPAE